MDPLLSSTVSYKFKYSFYLRFFLYTITPQAAPAAMIRIITNGAIGVLSPVLTGFF